MLTAEPQLLTVEEVAAELRVHVETVRRLLATKRLTGARGEGTRSHWRISRAALDRYIAGETTDVASLPAHGVGGA